MIFNKITKTLLVGALLILPACGPTASSPNTGLPSVEDPVGQPPATPEVPDLKSVISGGFADRVQVLQLDAEKGELLLSIPLGKNVSVNFSEREISSKLPGARIYSSTGSDGNKYIVVAVPLRYVLRNVTQIPKGTLPSGDPLPALPAGELPTVALAISNSNNVKVHLYVGMDAVGIFVESRFNPFIGLEYDILNKTQQKVGVFALIPAKGAYQGGFFLGIRLKEDIARALDRFIK